jgi:chromosome segregation ATPase
LKQARALEKALRAELEQVRTAVESSASQNEAVRRAERDMLEKQLSQLQADAIRLNTQLGVATARLADAESTATSAKGAAAARDADAARLLEQLQKETSTTAATKQELEACRAELGVMQTRHAEWGNAAKAELERTQTELERTQRELQSVRGDLAQRGAELDEQRIAAQKIGVDLAEARECLSARDAEAETLRAGMAEAAEREKRLQSVLAERDHALKRWQNLHPDSQPGTPTHSMSLSRPQTPGTLAAELDNERSRAKVRAAISRCNRTCAHADTTAHANTLAHPWYHYFRFSKLGC